MFVAAGRTRRAARIEELIARQLDANHVAVAADVDVGIMNDRQRLQEAVVGRDRHARLTPQAGREGPGLGVDFLLFALDLGQLGRRAAELLGHGGQAVFQQLGLLLLLGQQGFLVLVVAIQRVNARLIQFVLLLQGGLLLLVLGHAALQHHRIVGTAGQSDQPQGHRSRRPRRAWHGRRPPSNPPRNAPGDILFACIDSHKEGFPVMPTATGGPDVSKPLISGQEQFLGMTACDLTRLTPPRSDCLV